mgnify:CR=1 FL=1
MENSKYTSSHGNWLTRFEENAEFDRFSIISVGFLLIGIVGGITVGMFVQAHIWQIAVIAVCTMLSLSTMLAVMPMKYIVRATLVTLAIDLLYDC